MSKGEYALKIRDRRAYVILYNGCPAGILRYNLFWDNTPFCTLLYITDKCRNMGLGRHLMEYWEADMKSLGYGFVLTSTQADENAQHFYRRLGYRDCGGLVIDVNGEGQPMELFMIKVI